MERISPDLIYISFKGNYHNRISDRQYYETLNKALDCILTTIKFEEGEYEKLHKSLSCKYQYHYNSDWHYQIACEADNHSVVRQIESFLNRKPFIFDSKRCYDGFEFSTTDGDTYKCTGFDGDKIKFKVWFKKPEYKLLKFSYSEFKEYFSVRKMVKY